MSNDQQAVRRWRIGFVTDPPLYVGGECIKYEPRPAMIEGNWSPDCDTYVKSADHDKLAARLAEAEGREKRLREALRNVLATLLAQFPYEVGKAMPVVKDAEAALSTEEKP